MPTKPIRAKLNSLSKALLTLTVAALAVSGCGGNGGGKHYDLSATKACLQEAGVDVKVDTNPFATGSEGNLDADFSDFDLFIAFGSDDGEARDLKQQIEGLGSALGGEAEGSVEQRGNVMFYSNSDTPSEEVDEREQVRSCLREADGQASRSTSVQPEVAPEATPAELARFTRQARGVIKAIPPEAYFTFSPEGKEAFGELEELSRDGLLNHELPKVQKDLDILDRELAYYEKHKGSYSEDE